MECVICIVGALILIGLFLIIDFAYHWKVTLMLLPNDIKGFVKNVGYGIGATGFLLLAGVGGNNTSDGFIALFLGYAAVKLSDMLN